MFINFDENNIDIDEKPFLSMKTTLMSMTMLLKLMPMKTTLTSMQRTLLRWKDVDGQSKDMDIDRYNVDDVKELISTAQNNLNQLNCSLGTKYLVGQPTQPHKLLTAKYLCKIKLRTMITLCIDFSNQTTNVHWIKDQFWSLDMDQFNLGCCQKIINS
jgi:hypothetical protein